MPHGGMKFPVDLLADVSQTELERLGHNYMNSLLYSDPDSPEHLTLSDSTQVTIDITSAGFVPLYGSSDKQKILALFSPSDPLTAVGLYLLDQWWAVDDILKTADPARDGAVEVETVGERIVLYILNRVIYRAKEMSSSEELPFLCHGEKDNAKILWSNGEAVGFYSVKPAGSSCNSYSTRSYLLPVMDSIFVRKCQRGKGFGVQMLEDFVLSFKEDCLGLRWPLTKSMYKVCEKYLCQYPGDTDLLWEVESIGLSNQRTNIASKIQAMDKSVSKSLTFTEESLVITEMTEKDMMMEAITTQIQEAGSMECTVEIVEEVKLLSATKEAEVPLTARGRSSGSKRRKMGEKIAEDKSEKVIRIEDIEAETPREEHVSAQQKTELHVSELVQTEGMFSVAPEEQVEDVVDTAPEEAAIVSDQPATVLAPQDLEEADITSGPTTEEPQAEGDAPQDLNNSSHDSQITVENVASEIEEELEKEDAAELVVSEEVLDDHKEKETLDEVGAETQVVTDEESEERVTQHEASLSTRATSENGEAGKTERTVVKDITTVQSRTPIRRSTRHSKLEEETTAQDGGLILRGRALMSPAPPKRKYTRRSQKVCEELEKEVEEVAEEKDGSTTEVEEELAVTEGEEQEETSSIKEDVVDTAPEEAAMMSDQPATVLAPQNLEEADVTSGPMTEEPQAEGDAPQDLNNTSCDSQITDENVASEIEEECEKEDAAKLVVSEEVLEDRKEAETLDKVGEETQVVVTDEKSEERVTQHEASLSTRATSENGEAGKTERTVVKAITTVQSKTPRRRSMRHNKLEEETTAQDGGLILRGRTLINTPPPKRKYTRRSKKVREELEKEVEEMAEEKDVSTTEVVEELAITEGEEQEEMSTIKEDVVAVEELTEETQQLKDEHLTNEEKTEEQQEPGVEDTVVKGSSTELPDTAEMALTEENEDGKVTDESEKEPNGEEVEPSVIQDKEGIPVETEEPPAGGSASEETADEQATDKQMEQEGTVDKTEEEMSTEELTVVEEGTIPKAEEAAEDIIPLTEVNMEERKEVQEEEETEGETETVSVMEAENKEEAVSVSGATDDIIQEPVAAAASETVIPDKVLSEAVVPAAEEPQIKDIGSEIPKIQKATVILVDIKTTCHTLSVKEAEESPVNGDSADPEKQQEEEGGGMQENIPEKSVDVTAEAEIVEKEELESDNFEKENQQQEEDNIGEDITEKEVDAETGTDEVEGEMEAVAKDTITVTVPVEEKQSAVSEICADREADIPVGDDAEENLPPAEVDEAMSSEEEEPPVVETRALRGRTKTSKATPVRKSTRSRKQVDAQEAENSDEEEPAVTTRTLRRGRISVPDTPKGKSRRSQKEGGGASTEKSTDGNELPVETRILRRGRKSARGRPKKVQKEEERPKESAEESEVEEEEEEAGLGSAEEPPTEGDEGKAPEEDKIEVENEELVTAEVEKGESEEGTMTMTEDEENTAGVTTAAHDLVQGDAPLPKPATDAAVLAPSEEDAAPSAEEQQNEEMAPHLSDLRTVTVVLVDLQKPHHDVQEETAAPDECPPVQKTAAEAEEEQKEETTKEEDKLAQENVPGSPVGTEEEGFEDKVEAVSIQETALSTEETAKEEEAISSNNEEQEPTVPETRMRSSRKKAVEDTPRTKLARTRQKRGEVEEEAASEIQKEEPAVQVRVLRRGRKSIPVTPRSTTKRTRKQLQEEEEEEGEESTAEEEEEKQQMIDQEKGERLEERDATEQVENTAVEMGIEKEDTVAEEAVIQQDAPEQGQADSTETVADDVTEAPVGQHADEGKTSVVPEEAVTTQDTVEGEQSMSTSEVAESAAGERAQETLLTAKDDQAKGASEEEEAPVVERVLRSGGKTTRATRRSKTTKQQDVEQEEEATGEKSTEEDEPAVEARVLRKGRKTAAATPRRKSKRARTQCPTEEDEEEEEEEETTPPEEIQVEETKAVLEEAGEKEKSRDEKVEVKDGDEAAAQEEENTEPEVEMEKVEAVAEEIKKEEKEAGQGSLEEKGEEVEEEGKIMEMEKDKDEKEVEEGESAVGDAEQTKDASTDEAAVLEEEDNSVEAVVGVDTDKAETSAAEVEEINSAAEVGSDTAIADEEARVEDASVVAEEEAPPVTTRALKGKIKTSCATPSQGSRRQKDQGVVEAQEQEEETSEEEEEVHLFIDDSPRRSVRKRTRVDYRETDEEGEQVETQAAMDEEGENRVESDVDKDSKEAECSSDTDDEVDEGDEQSMSEEEEPIVIGKRVLRGRSIPSVIITPKSKARGRSAKLSNEEESPRSAQKRKNTEVTPARKSKRLSRV
ncbi:titin-like isoform X2 [Sebastes umbrosus]|uniref:titin-like isoform X2 n=1 Tax=Sebastes umbrosus TaxID=72105 RepID=UPI00189F64EC|nr:titin-like isoform X2 [Sebastes umbrosus]